MPQILKTKTAGLPRWAWLTMFSSAVLIGLYLRSRDTGDSEITAEEPEIEGSPDELDYFDGTESAGGLAAAGLVGPAGSQVVPVQAPYLPEGITDIFADQSAVISQLGTYIVENPNERTETIREVEPLTITGGGAPRRNRQRKAKKKKPAKKKTAKKPAKKKAKKPSRKKKRRR